jgi:hypothetical protein
VTAILAGANVSAWWVLPLGVVLALFASLRRVATDRP